MVIKGIFNKTKGVLSQSEGLGYLQVYNLMKAIGIVIISIIFAKLIKTPLLINHWETLMLMGTSYTFFYVSGMGYTLVSFVKSYHKQVWPHIFKNTFLLLFTFSCLSSIGIVLTGFLLQTFAIPLPELLLFCVYIIGTVCSTVIEYIYFLKRSFKKLIGWGIFNLVLFVTVPTLPLVYGIHFIYSLYGLAMLGVIKFIFTLTLIEKPFHFNELSYLKPILKFNWPIIISLLFGTGIVYVANFIVKAGVSINEFNLFRYGIREFPLFIVMANSFSIVVGGITAEKYNSPGYWDSIKKSHLRLMHQLFPLACILMISSKYLFEIIYSDAFIPAYTVFNILLMTVIPRQLFPQSFLMGQGKTRYAFFSSVVEFVIGFGLVVIFTPLFGIKGAAFGLAIAYFMEKSILILFCYRQKITFHKSINLKWFIFYCMLLIISFIYSLS